AQYTEFAPPTDGIQALPPGMVKYEIFPRSDVAPNVTIDPKQGITTLNGGVRVVIEGLAVDGLPAGMGPLGAIDLSTDRAVIWSAPGGAPNGAIQGQEQPLEIY